MYIYIYICTFKRYMCIDIYVLKVYIHIHSRTLWFPARAVSRAASMLDVTIPRIKAKLNSWIGGGGASVQKLYPKPFWLLKLGCKRVILLRCRLS